jgi:hypothetical protein
MAADGRKSNLTMPDMKKRGFKLRTPKQTQALTKTAKYPGAFVWSYLIPYYDIDGKLVRDYWRVRYLEEVTGRYGGKPRKPRKYTGPEGAQIRFYFDPTCSYKKVNDNGSPILIVEGEKKAACAVKDGYVAIGVGGVGCWQQNGKPLSDFDLIDWQGGDAVLFFDSDYRGNPNVKRELNKLARELTRRNAIVRRAEPPDDEDGEKQGYDDCRKNLGKRATAKIVKNAVPFDLPPDMIDLLNEVWFVAIEGSNVRIYSDETGEGLREQDFKLLYANRFVEDDQGTRKPLGEAWIKHPLRRQYSQTIFDPDAAPDPYVFNRYKPCNIEPTQGDWSLYEEHMRENLCGKNDEYYDYLFNWMARAVQQKGKPAEMAVVLRGPQGVGKGVFVSSFAKFFEPHFFHAATANDVTGRFAAHTKDTLLLFLDEAFFAGDKRHVGALKKLITESTRSIEAKHKDTVTQPNRIKMIMASNEHWVIPAAFRERRFFVLDVGTKRQQDTEYFGRLKNQLRNGGYGGLLHDLLSHDISQFNHRDCPNTEALQEQQVYSYSEVELYWSGILDDGEMPHGGTAIKGQNRPSGWGVIRKETLHRDFINQARDRGITRLPDVSQFRHQLAGMLPDGWPRNVRPRVDGKRQNCWEFPSLKECRRAFSVVRGGLDKNAGTLTKTGKKNKK